MIRQTYCIRKRNRFVLIGEIVNQTKRNVRMRTERPLIDVYSTLLYIYTQVRFRSNPLFSLQGHLGRHPHQRIRGLADLTSFLYAYLITINNSDRVLGVCLFYGKT